MANEVTLANFGFYLKDNSQIGVQNFFELYQQLEKLEAVLKKAFAVYLNK